MELSREEFDGRGVDCNSMVSDFGLGGEENGSDKPGMNTHKDRKEGKE
jgi:hypothetical protein